MRIDVVAMIAALYVQELAQVEIVEDGESTDEVNEVLSGNTDISSRLVSLLLPRQPTAAEFVEALNRLPKYGVETTLITESENEVISDWQPNVFHVADMLDISPDDFKNAALEAYEISENLN